MIRTITLLYALFITGIIVCASNGWFPVAFAWVQTGINDKALHFLLVGTMAFLLNLSLNSASLHPGFAVFQWGTVVMLTIATLEETSQLWFRNRTFDLGDLACNYLGILLIGSLSLLFPSTIHKRKRFGI